MKRRSDATTWAVILMAATSLVSMICLYQIDNIVHGTLYSYGLQFSHNWAGPYWKLTQIGFTVGWLNIIIAFALQLDNIIMKRKAERPATAIEQAWEEATEPETEKAPEESVKEQKETEPTKPPEEAPKTAPEPEAQEKEEPQQPEKTPEKEPQLPEKNPDENTCLVQSVPSSSTCSHSEWAIVD